MLLQLVETVAGAGVHQQVADLDDHAAEQRGLHGDLQVDRIAGQRARASPRSRCWRVAHGVGGGHAGHPPAPGLGGVLDQRVEGGHDVAGPAAPGGVGGEPDGGRQGLALEQAGDDVLAARDGQVAVAEGVAQRPVGLDGPGEAEELVLDLLELGDRAALEDGGGVARDPVAGAQPAEDVLGGRLGGGRPAGGELVSRLPIQRKG